MGSIRVGLGTVDFTPPPHSPPTAEAIISLIGRAGGVAVVAHPRSDAPDGSARPNVAEVERLVAAGAVGVECYNVKAMPVEEREFWQAFCDERGLAFTGGTDWHGYVEEWNVLQRTAASFESVESLQSFL